MTPIFMLRAAGGGQGREDGECFRSLEIVGVDMEKFDASWGANGFGGYVNPAHFQNSVSGVFGECCRGVVLNANCAYDGTLAYRVEKVKVVFQLEYMTAKKRKKKTAYRVSQGQFSPPTLPLVAYVSSLQSQRSK